MTALEMKVNALVLIEVGSAEERETGREMLRMLRDELYPAATLEDTVDELLGELGIEGSWQYVRILRTALIRAHQRPGLADCASKGVYKVVGEIYGVSTKEVGRSISRCIETAYRREDPDKLNAFFRHQVSPVTGAPTPVNFLRRCLRELEQRMQIVAGVR